MQLTDEQQAAVRLATQDAPPLACLTGGPGTGKTTTLRQLLQAAGAAGLRAECAAPSGKAAQRMEEATGRPASTLHRLMSLVPGSRDWAPIHTNLLVIDEASMVDVPLMAATLQAARAGGVQTVLLVGDADQLPPVGPGQPFHDLLAGGVCPTVRLTQVHRQAAESGIVRAAHSIVKGEEPDFNETDFRLVECNDLEEIPAAVWATIEQNRLCPIGSQVLAPQSTTCGGVDAINAFVEAARRPVHDGELVRKLFRLGTKVINTKNDYTLNVFNGELGTVVNAQAGWDARRNKPLIKADELIVEIGGRRHTYKGGGISPLRPAWCLTVHKSQGSQWDDVVVVAHKGHTKMLTRRLLYVAVTRGAKRVWVVGQREAVARAVRNTTDARRHTWLANRFARDRAKQQEAASC